MVHVFNESEREEGSRINRGYREKGEVKANVNSRDIAIGITLDEPRSDVNIYISDRNTFIFILQLAP